MAVNIRHRFVSQKEDGPDTSLLQPTDWNADHTLTMAGPRLLGRTASGNGNAVEIHIGEGLNFEGNVLTSETGPIGDYVPTFRTVSTGDGLNGGGNLNNNRTLSVDDTVARTSGTQNIEGIKNFTGALLSNGVALVTDTRRIDAGDGLLGGGRLDSDITLRVDGTVVNGHDDYTIGGYKNFTGNLTYKDKLAATVYEGDWEHETNFPIGHMVLAHATTAARNQSIEISPSPDGRQYRNFGDNLLAGTWRSRGNYIDSMVVQRVA